MSTSRSLGDDLLGTLVAAIADRVAETVLAALRRDREAQPHATPEPPYYDARELAARWRIKPRTLETWRRRGKGPPYKQAGKRVLYSSAAVARWFEGCDAGASKVRKRGARRVAVEEAREV